MATLKKELEKCKQDPQIIFKMDETTIQMPFSKFDAILTEKLKKIMKDLDFGNIKNDTEDFFKLRKLNSHESIYKNLEIKLMCFQEIIKSFESDLKHDKFAQPKRPFFNSIYQNLKIKPNVKKDENVNQVIPLSNEEYEQPMTIENSTNAKTVQISSENKADLESKTTFVQTKEIECFDLSTSDED